MWRVWGQNTSVRPKKKTLLSTLDSVCKPACQHQRCEQKTTSFDLFSPRPTSLLGLYFSGVLRVLVVLVARMVHLSWHWLSARPSGLTVGWYPSVQVMRMVALSEIPGIFIWHCQPRWVGGCMGPKRAACEMLSLHNLFWDVVYLKHKCVQKRMWATSEKPFMKFGLFSQNSHFDFRI